MPKLISGTFTCTISFHDVEIEDGQDELDVLFPGGWEGEISYSNLDIEQEENEEY